VERPALFSSAEATLLRHSAATEVHNILFVEHLPASFKHEAQSPFQTCAFVK